MPYFPKEEESITLTLKAGETVTLKEKKLSAGERKALRKRALATGFDVRFKVKQGEDIDRRFEEAALDRDAFDEIADDAVVLFESMSDTVLMAYATVLSARFQSWDVYASREEFEQGLSPVKMERDTIIAYAESDSRNLVMIEHLMEALREYDGVEEKKEQSGQETGGSSSTAKAASSEKHLNA